MRLAALRDDKRQRSQHNGSAACEEVNYQKMRASTMDACICHLTPLDVAAGREGRYDDKANDERWYLCRPR
jgi:hypothetical protein